MPAVVVVQAAGTFGSKGILQVLPAFTGFASGSSLIMPPGVNVTDTRPSFATLNFSGKSRCYIVGGHTDNLVLDESYRLMRQGILPPTAPPTLAAGGGTGITGSAVGYISFWDDIGKRRSPLSAGTAPVALANQNRAWSVLPTFTPDDEGFPVGSTLANAATAIVGVGTDFLFQLRVGDRIALSSAATTFATVLTITDATHLTVSAAIGNGASQTFILRRQSGVTHVELWVSMDGSLPRLSDRVDLGLAAFTEGVATLALGEAFTSTLQKFPRCQWNVMYHQRQFMGGDSNYPNRTYYSFINDPENMEGYLETRTGEPVIAAFVVRDQLFIGCPASIQRIQGYTSSDFVVDVVEPQIGVLNHASIKVIHGYAIVPSQLGIYLCSGAFSPISGDYQFYWRKDYLINRGQYENSFAFDMRDDNCYKLCVGAGAISDSVPAIYDPATPVTDVNYPVISATVGSAYWVLDYSTLLPEAGGAYVPPEVLFDAYNRTHSCAFEIAYPGSSRRDVYVGIGGDGKVYRERSTIDPSASDDDAGDLYLKRLWIIHGVDFDGDPGGDDKDGKDYKGIWVYVWSENDPWSLELRAGDESIIDRLPAQFAATVAASFAQDASTNDLTAQVRHAFSTAGVLQGMGVQVKLWVDTPHTASWAYRGYGGIYGPGATERGVANYFHQPPP